MRVLQPVDSSRSVLPVVGRAKDDSRSLLVRLTASGFSVNQIDDEEQHQLLSNLLYLLSLYVSKSISFRSVWARAIATFGEGQAFGADPRVVVYSCAMSTLAVDRDTSE